MKKRMLIVISCLVVLIAGLGFFKYQQIQAAIKGGAWTPPPEAVTTTVATEAQWEGTMHAIGSATAVDGVMVSAICANEDDVQFCLLSDHDGHLVSKR